MVSAIKEAGRQRTVDKARTHRRMTKPLLVIWFGSPIACDQDGLIGYYSTPLWGVSLPEPFLVLPVTRIIAWARSCADVNGVVRLPQVGWRGLRGPGLL